MQRPEDKDAWFLEKTERVHVAGTQYAEQNDMLKDVCSLLDTKGSHRRLN